MLTVTTGHLDITLHVTSPYTTPIPQLSLPQDRAGGEGQERGGDVQQGQAKARQQCVAPPGTAPAASAVSDQLLGSSGQETQYEAVIQCSYTYT